MALGTVTVTKIRNRAASSSLKIVEFTVVGDTSYPTGGTLLVEATLRAALEAQDERAGSLSGLDLISAIQCDLVADRIVRYLPNTDALAALVISTGAQVANTTNLSGETYRLVTMWA